MTARIEAFIAGLLVSPTSTLLRLALSPEDLKAALVQLDVDQLSAGACMEQAQKIYAAVLAAIDERFPVSGGAR